MYTTLYRIESSNQAENPVCEAAPHLMTPPTASRTARNRSVLKCRSANCPAMNGAAIAPIEPARPRMVPICVPVKPNPPPALLEVRDRAAGGSQAPHTAYCRNIISERRPTFEFIGAPGGGR